MAQRDRFGFLFWLQWICLFAGSIVAVSFFWTFSLTRLFGEIRGNEVTATWALAVFGSWFLLVVPFIRKKEQIWKRLNDDQEKAVDAWLKGMSALLILIITSSFLWSLWFKDELNPQGGWHGGWIKAMAVTWLVMLMPVLIWMYKKADQIMKAAEERQLTYQPKFKTDFVERDRRLIPAKCREKIKAEPPILENGHIVTVVLNQGRKIPYVFVLKSEEILGVYDQTSLDFDSRDICDVEFPEAGELPKFDEAKWLRLDGRA